MPAAPQQLTRTRYARDYISVEWQPPLDDGGLAITNYSVSIRSDDGNNFIDFTPIRSYLYYLHIKLLLKNIK